MDKKTEKWWNEDPHGVVDYLEDTARDEIWDINSEPDGTARSLALCCVSDLATLCRRLLKEVKNDG